MNCTEKLHWILDAPGKQRKGDAEYRINIDFVHSLGLKCDCVGWSRLDLSDPRAEEILEAVSRFCKDTGWTGRCLYTREFTNVESDWYELIPTDFRDAATSERITIPAEDGSGIHSWTLLAYHETAPGPRRLAEGRYLPERFREVCVENGIEDLDFCWARDKGRYAAGQYFQVFGKRQIPRLALGYKLNEGDPEQIQAAGGQLKRVAEVFSTLQQVNLPDCYLAEDLPAGGIVCAYLPMTHSFIGRHNILIHRDVAQILLREKALSPSALRPAPVVDTVPGGYVLMETAPIPRPAADFSARMLAEYEKLKATARPVRQIPEKDALKILRKAKKDRKEDFRKALPKAKLPELDGTDCSPLVPYYGVSNGGYLSDEYELLAYEQAGPETAAFFARLKTEELLDDTPDGVAMGKCPDGDRILLCANGTVLRFSHEAPEEVCRWPSPAQFIFDAVTENE